MRNQLKPTLSFNHFTGLLTLETLAGMIYLLALPRDPKNSLLLGYSLQRLALVAFLGIFLLLFGFFTWKISRNPQAFKASRTRFLGSRGFGWSLFGLFILFLAGFLWTNYPRYMLLDTQLAYYERLMPIAVWQWIICLETMLVLYFGKRALSEPVKADMKRTLLPAVVVFLGMLCVWLLIHLTQLGLTVDPVSWRQMGSPLLVWQICVALLAAALLAWAEAHWLHFFTAHNRWVEVVLLIAVYSLTLALWLPQPIQPAYSAPRVTPPNYEIYPYSDAMYYSAAAESLLTGNGLYGHAVVPRPFFITVLAFLIQAADGKFEQVIFLQTFLLAFIPVLLYLIGRDLGGRPLGLAAAVMAAFREVDAIATTTYLQVSHSKLLLSDMPTLLATLLFTWLLIRWLKDHPIHPVWAVLAGSGLGWVMLFRTQFVVVLPVLWMVLALQKRMPWRRWLPTCGLITLGLILMVLPWLVRNYSLTHQFIFDDSQTQTQFVAGRYQFDDSGDTGNADGSIGQAILQHPLQVAGFIANHFLRNEICILFVTPPVNLYDSVKVTMEQVPFWHEDAIRLTGVQALQLAVVLLLMSIGLVSQWRKNHWAGLLPLILQLAYTGSNALARNSAGRYNLPVDWTGYFYLAAGVLQLWAWVIDNLTEVKPISEASPARSGRSLIFAAAAVLLVGAIIPLTELAYPQRYGPIDAALLPGLLKSWGVAQSISATDSQILYGRELYPRYYQPGTGEQGSNWVAFSPQDYCRMGFIVMGTDGVHQVIVRVNKPPEGFGNRADVVVLGKNAEGLVRGQSVVYVDAQTIILRDSSGVKVFQAEPANGTCEAGNLPVD
jgi:hypothetical protein